MYADIVSGSSEMQRTTSCIRI